MKEEIWRGLGLDFDLVRWAPEFLWVLKDRLTIGITTPLLINSLFFLLSWEKVRITAIHAWFPYWKRTHRRCVRLAPSRWPGHADLLSLSQLGREAIS
jgi:hypothetical protein